MADPLLPPAALILTAVDELRRAAHDMLATFAESIDLEGEPEQRERAKSEIIARRRKARSAILDRAPLVMLAADRWAYRHDATGRMLAELSPGGTVHAWATSDGQAQEERSVQVELTALRNKTVVESAAERLGCVSGTTQPALPPDRNWLRPPLSLAEIARRVLPDFNGKPAKAKPLLIPYNLRPWPGGNRQRWTLDLDILSPAQRKALSHPIDARTRAA
jgi:hypothetical protein